MKRLIRDPYLWIFLAFLFYPLYPYLGSYISLGTELLIWFIFTLSFNLCLGYTGLPSFGHGAFYGLGTYAAALTFRRLYGKGGFVGPIIMGAIVGALFAGAVGWVIRNKKGVYFAM